MIKLIELICYQITIIASNLNHHKKHGEGGLKIRSLKTFLIRLKLWKDCKKEETMELSSVLGPNNSSIQLHSLIFIKSQLRPDSKRITITTDPSVDSMVIDLTKANYHHNRRQWERKKYYYYYYPIQRKERE